MAMMAFSLMWALAALGVALALGRAIRCADSGTDDGTWEAFCAAHGLDEDSPTTLHTGT